MLTNTLLTEIIDFINEDAYFTSYITATRGFQKTAESIPIKKITFSVVPEENKSTYFEDESANTCIKTSITVRINVYAPVNRSGTQINSLAELTLDSLADHFLGQMTGYEIGDMDYDDHVNAILLPCRLFFEYTSCALETDTTDPSDSVPDTFFCKSHVNDTEIHLSADDRTRLNAPFIIGSYTGNGSDDGLDITLDFRPAAVIVYRNSYHIASYNSSDSLSHCYSGFAIGTSYTRGILLLDTGFRVKTVATTNATTHLNDNGGTYTYIAFR